MAQERSSPHACSEQCCGSGERVTHRDSRCQHGQDFQMTSWAQARLCRALACLLHAEGADFNWDIQEQQLMKTSSCSKSQFLALELHLLLRVTGCSYDSSMTLTQVLKVPAVTSDLGTQGSERRSCLGGHPQPPALRQLFPLADVHICAEPW